MAIEFILVIAAIVAAVVWGLTSVLRRRAMGSPRHPPGEARGGVVAERPSGSAWRDQFMYPTVVSIVSGVVVAAVLYLLGLR